MIQKQLTASDLKVLKQRSGLTNKTVKYSSVVIGSVLFFIGFKLLIFPFIDGYLPRREDINDFLSALAGGSFTVAMLWLIFRIGERKIIGLIKKDIAANIKICREGVIQKIEDTTTEEPVTIYFEEFESKEVFVFLLRTIGDISRHYKAVNDWKKLQTGKVYIEYAPYSGVVLSLDLTE